MDDNDRIANCLICTIADSLKACNACQFNIGLKFRQVKAQELSADSLLRIEEIRRDKFIPLMKLYANSQA